MGKTLQASIVTPARVINPDALLAVADTQTALADLPELCRSISGRKNIPSELEIFSRYYSRMALEIWRVDYNVSVVSSCRIAANFDVDVAEELRQLLEEQQARTIETCLAAISGAKSPDYVAAMRQALLTASEADRSRYSPEQGMGVAVRLTQEVINSWRENWSIDPLEMDQQLQNLYARSGMFLRKSAVDQMNASPFLAGRARRLSGLEHGAVQLLFALKIDQFMKDNPKLEKYPQAVFKEAAIKAAITIDSLLRSQQWNDYLIAVKSLEGGKV